MQIRKIFLLICAFSFGLIMVPAANAEVIVHYVVVDNGYSHHEPMGYQPGSRLYSKGSRFKHNTYSSHDQYRNRYNHQRDHHRDYHQPRQYRNNYYSGNRYRDSRCGGSVYYRDDRKSNHRYNQTRDRRHYSSFGHNDGRVHITIK